MNSPDPTPTPAPPPAMPWYRSPIIVSAVALILVRVLNHLKTAYHIDLGTLFGMDANTMAEYVIDGAVTVAGAIIIWARGTQKHAPQIVFKPPKGDTVQKASMFLLAGIIAVLIAAGGLAGCSIFNTTNNALNTGIELATSVYITHKGGGTPAGDLAAAQQVKAVAVELQGVATGSLTVAQFNAQMSAYIAKLNPTEQILAAGLLTQIDFYLAQQVSNNVLSASLSAQANVVLGDVIAACALYGA